MNRDRYSTIWYLRNQKRFNKTRKRNYHDGVSLWERDTFSVLTVAIIFQKVARAEPHYSQSKSFSQESVGRRTTTIDTP